MGMTGFDADNVPRLNKFRAEHPDWVIGLSEGIGVWHATRGDPPEVEEHFRVRLDHLLDVLEGIEQMESAPCRGRGREGDEPKDEHDRESDHGG